MISSGVSIIFFQFILFFFFVVAVVFFLLSAVTTNCRIIVDEFRCNACVEPLLSVLLLDFPDGTNKIHTCYII